MPPKEKTARRRLVVLSAERNYQPLVTKRTLSRSKPMSLVNIELHGAVVTHLQ
jgi:hypothetical protein